MFKSVSFFKYDGDIGGAKERILSDAADMVFAPVNAVKKESFGLVPVLDQEEGLVLDRGEEVFLRYKFEKLSIPAAAVNDKVAEFVSGLPSKPSSTEKAKIKEDIKAEMAKDAFPISKDVFVLATDDFLAVGSSSESYSIAVALDLCKVFKGLAPIGKGGEQHHSLKMTQIVFGWPKTCVDFKIDGYLKSRRGDSVSIFRCCSPDSDDVCSALAEGKKITDMKVVVPVGDGRIGFTISDGLIVRGLRHDLDSEGDDSDYANLIILADAIKRVFEFIEKVFFDESKDESEDES